MKTPERVPFVAPKGAPKHCAAERESADWSHVVAHFWQLNTFPTQQRLAFTPILCPYKKNLSHTQDVPHGPRQP